MKRKKMKKWIPEDIYCTQCKWWKEIWNSVINTPYKHKREECQFGNKCNRNCEECKEIVCRCEFLGYTEYGQFPLGDQCKICGIRNRLPHKER